MRILIIAPMAPLADGPGATPTLLHSQLIALAPRHELTVVTGIGDEPWETEAARSIAAGGAPPGVEIHFADRRLPPTARLRLRRRLRLASRWALTDTPWLALWFGAPAVQAVIDRVTARRSFDLIDVEDGSMAMFRLPDGVPRVMSEHEVRRPRPTIWRPGPPARWPGWGLRELDYHRWGGYQRAGWQRYERLMVFSERDARTVRELAPEVSGRVRINPFGLALPPLPDNNPREDPDTVLFTGNFTHAPNRDAALWLAREIMPRVRARHAPARLRLVGSTPPDDIRELAGDGVELIADVPEVDPYIASAAVCAAPVRIGGGMRMKVLYALAAGKPVVTTSRGAEGYLEDAGGPPPMVIADEAEAIAGEIATLLSDARRRAELGARARAYAESYHSAAAWGGRLDAVYAEVADGP